MVVLVRRGRIAGNSRAASPAKRAGSGGSRAARARARPRRARPSGPFQRAGSRGRSNEQHRPTASGSSGGSRALSIYPRRRRMPQKPLGAHRPDPEPIRGDRHARRARVPGGGVGAGNPGRRAGCRRGAATRLDDETSRGVSRAATPGALLAGSRRPATRLAGPVFGEAARSDGQSRGTGSCRRRRRRIDFVGVFSASRNSSAATLSPLPFRRPFPSPPPPQGVGGHPGSAFPACFSSPPPPLPLSPILQPREQAVLQFEPSHGVERHGADPPVFARPRGDAL